MPLRPIFVTEGLLLHDECLACILTYRMEILNTFSLDNAVGNAVSASFVLMIE